LGLKFQVNVMDWSGALQSAASGRADIVAGGMAYTTERTKTFAMSKPIEWEVLDLTQKKSTNYAAIEDLKGKTLGTIVGYSWIESAKSVPWIGNNLKLYPGADAALLDLQAGRVDALMLGASFGSYITKQRPDYDLK